MLSINLKIINKKIDGVFKKIKVIEDQDGTKSIKICND
jgi:hypothetical protein